MSQTPDELQLLTPVQLSAIELPSHNTRYSPEERLQVILMDLQVNYHQHKRTVEDYLLVARDLASNEDFLVRIIIEEFKARIRTGDSPSISEYIDRFPQVAQILDKVLAVEQFRDENSFATKGGDSFVVLNDRYKLSGKPVGSGTFGDVYLAFDMKLDRPVAVKLPNLQSPESLPSSYLNEARTLAKFQHPNIVSIYDIDSTKNGRIFIVSQFVWGGTLRSNAEEYQGNYKKIADTIASVAEALQFAHDRKIIHRDIKPANILVDAKSKRPLLTDFGLAVSEESLGACGSIAGTDAYMSPEQVRGENHRVDARTDLFSLGVVLYELLTGTLPFRGSSTEIHRGILQEEPVPPSSYDPSIPQELERICLKALSKPLSGRYPTAETMAQDLRSWDAVHFVDLKDRLNQRITPRGLRAFDSTDADYYLSLIPGLRDRSGLPESIAFWKEWIEQRDLDTTFSVGLMYGPSGCGKTSLVKAGLIPILSKDIVVVYVEATAHETNKRLLRMLRKRIPELPQDQSLPETLLALRRSNGRKVVLIIDQFEQWLHSQAIRSDGELEQGLRQCDGIRLQTVLMVRDDFYLAAARLMNLIEIPIVTHENLGLIDLFDKEHAQRVMIRYGQAHGKLPIGRESLRKDQMDFVKDLIDGLSEGDKVVPVRIALLAEMLKNREWVPSTIETLGGLKGIGVEFLEETFSSNRADIRHRIHESAARGILSSLLPEFGLQIKGGVRSKKELLEASGYRERISSFDEVIQILDRELRLISPTDPDGDSQESGVKSYQLAHDYLVPSLREWLTRKQRETRKGRAELKLAESASAWDAYKEKRQLPSFLEWLQIQHLTSSSKWKPHERVFMKQANRQHMRTLTLCTIAIALVAIVGWLLSSEIAEREEEQRISGLVETLTLAEPSEIPLIVEKLDSNSKVADKYLKSLLGEDALTDDRQRAKLHARMASVKRDPTHLDHLLHEMLANKISYFLPIREILKPTAAKLIEPLTRIIHNEQLEPERRFRAVLALADYLPPTDNGVLTESDYQFMVKQLVSSNPEFQPTLRQALRPIHGKLLKDLEIAYSDTASTASEKMSAANAFADYSAKDIQRLTRLLTRSNPDQHAVLYPLISEESRLEVVSQLGEVASAFPTEGLDAKGRIDLGQQRANAAVTMLRLGEKQRVLSVFNWTDDPEALTQFIFRCKPRGVSISVLLDLFDHVADAPNGTYPRDARYALLLAIGEYGQSEIPTERFQKLVRRLADWYANDPSSGVHAASGWLLRHLGQKELTDKIDKTAVPFSSDREWFTLAITLRQRLPLHTETTESKDVSNVPEVMNQRGSEIAGLQEEHTARRPTEDLNQKSFYYTFIVYPPGEYMVGSAEGEVDRDPRNEIQHKVLLTRPFALLDREISFEEAIAFLPPYTVLMNELNAEIHDSAFGANWYELVSFCRWLGSEMGLDESDQCYAAPESLSVLEYARDPQVPNAPRNWPLDIHKPGFRLPTESEWEAANRSGSRCRFGFGSDDELLARFGWFAGNSGKKVHPSKELRPSFRGLFDIHGNLFEWTHDWNGDFNERVQTDPLGALTGSYRVARGGSFGSVTSICRSGYRSYDNPTARSTRTGVRLALTPQAPIHTSGKSVWSKGGDKPAQ